LFTGWTTEDNPDEIRLQTLSIEMVEEILIAGGEAFDYLKFIDNYECSGTASDWFYSDEANVNNKYRAAPFVFEIGEYEDFGFELPSSQVKIDKKTHRNEQTVV